MEINLWLRLLSGKTIDLISDVDIIDHDYREKKQKPGWAVTQMFSPGGTLPPKDIWQCLVTFWLPQLGSAIGM